MPATLNDGASLRSYHNSPLNTQSLTFFNESNQAQYSNLIDSQGDTSSSFSQKKTRPLSPTSMGSMKWLDQRVIIIPSELISLNYLGA
jgi:hypothetical protein